MMLVDFPSMPPVGEWVPSLTASLAFVAALWIYGRHRRHHRLRLQALNRAMAENRLVAQLQPPRRLSLSRGLRSRRWCARILGRAPWRSQ